MEIEFVFIPIICILSIVDILFTYNSVKEVRAMAEKKKMKIEAEDMELNKLAVFIWKKWGLESFKYIMIIITMTIISGSLLYAHSISIDTYILGIGLYVGSYFVIIRIHVHNHLFFKKRKQKENDNLL